MGFFDWILKGVGVEPEDNGEEKERKTKKDKKEKQDKKAKKNSQEFVSETVARDTESFASNPDQFNTQNYYYDAYSGGGQTQSNLGGYGTKNIVIYYPKNYDDVQHLIDYLKQGESAVMNLDGISDAEAQRILDFVSGAVYALSGSIHRITGNIFMLTPEGFNIMVPKV